MQNIKVHQVGKILDASTSAEEQAAILAILDQNENVALDLSHCTYVSSAGLRVMLYSFKVAKSKKLVLYLVRVSDDVKDVMKMTGFDKFFTYFNTVDECLKS
ncbi:MAG: STAS domain-containing protein [Bacteroidaceae bacterium]|nr:STAS domain-containing protein [Bacteroidaceae bacterium]